MAPSYLSWMLQPKPTSRYFLRSNNENLLLVPGTRCKTFGDRASVVAGLYKYGTIFLYTLETLKTLIVFKIKLKHTFLKKLFIKNSSIQGHFYFHFTLIRDIR